MTINASISKERGPVHGGKKESKGVCKCHYVSASFGDSLEAVSWRCLYIFPWKPGMDNYCRLCTHVEEIVIDSIKWSSAPVGSRPVTCVVIYCNVISWLSWCLFVNCFFAPYEMKSVSLMFTHHSFSFWSSILETIKWMVHHFIFICKPPLLWCFVH